MQKIAVILVNYNGKKYNDSCIESVFCSAVTGELEIIIVDNASTDGSLELLRAKWGSNDKVIIISLKKNYGFSRANNVGLEWAYNNGAEYFLLLNNDTEIAEDAIENMMMLQKRTSAIIVPRIVYADRPDCLWCAGGYFSRVIWKPVQRGLNQKDTGQYGESEQCFFANGCSMLLSREIIQRLGKLDEKFFLYYEDVEYSFRARERQVPVWYCADAVVLHKVNGSTFGNERPDNAYYISRNWLLCNHKYMKRRFLLFWIYFVLNRAAWLMIWFFTGRTANITAAMDGVRDYRKGVTGQYSKNSL